jgi:hypothetical protein
VLGAQPAKSNTAVTLSIASQLKDKNSHKERYENTEIESQMGSELSIDIH